MPEQDSPRGCPVRNEPKPIGRLTGLEVQQSGRCQSLGGTPSQIRPSPKAQLLAGQQIEHVQGEPPVEKPVQPAVVV